MSNGPPVASCLSLMVVGAVLLSLAVAGPAHADCEKGKRISRAEAECLSGEWTNRSWPKKSTVRAVNERPGWGKVVAKIDIKDAADSTWHLLDGNERSRRGFFKVRDVTCCSDLSELCSRVDAVTERGCLAKYRGNSAAATCSGETAVGNIGDLTYTITGRCRFRRGVWEYMRQTTITVPYLDVGNLNNCHGIYVNGDC